MRRFALIAAILMVWSTLIGCSRTIVPEPKKITFEDAMVQVANGLNKMYDIGKGYPKSGLVPAEVIIDFNISASATDAGKLSVEVGPNTLGALQVSKAGTEIDSQIQASRGNRITIKFTNLFLSTSKDSLVMIKTPAEITELLKVLKESGYQPVYKNMR